jgi:hypothetical protein
MLYWRAWLTAIGFNFDRHISEREVITFIVQHAEGLDAAIDCMYAKVDSLDWHNAEKNFASIGKELSKRRAKDLGIIDNVNG